MTLRREAREPPDGSSSPSPFLTFTPKNAGEDTPSTPPTSPPEPESTPTKKGRRSMPPSMLTGLQRAPLSTPVAKRNGDVRSSVPLRGPPDGLPRVHRPMFTYDSPPDVFTSFIPCLPRTPTSHTGAFPNTSGPQDYKPCPHPPAQQTPTPSSSHAVQSSSWLVDRLHRLALPQPPKDDEEDGKDNDFAPSGKTTPKHPLPNLVVSPPTSSPNGNTAVEGASRMLDGKVYRVFRPMESNLASRKSGGSGGDQQERHRAPPTLEQAVMRAGRGFSPNYRGNIELDRNRSADIPSDKNCSLFIVGLPAALTIRELLGSIRDAGRIYATHINGPDPRNGHLTSAAKVIFFERAAAARFYDRCQAAGGLAIAGRHNRHDQHHPSTSSTSSTSPPSLSPPSSSSLSSVSSSLQSPPHNPRPGRVLWNRIRTAEQEGPRFRSRVLIIAGDPAVVNETFLTGYFRTKLNFQIDEVIEHGGAPGRAIIEYRFGSYRCQAESARMSLGYEFSSSRVQVWFGPDPCEGGAAALAAKPLLPPFPSS